MWSLFAAVYRENSLLDSSDAKRFGFKNEKAGLSQGWRNGFGLAGTRHALIASFE